MLIDLRSAVILLSLVGIILMGSLTIYSVTSIDIYYFLRFLAINIFAIVLVTLSFIKLTLIEFCHSAGYSFWGIFCLF